MASDSNSGNTPAPSEPLTVGFIGFDERGVAILHRLKRDSKLNGQDSPFHQAEFLASGNPKQSLKWREARSILEADNIRLKMKSNKNVIVLERSNIIILLTRPGWTRKLLDRPEAPSALRAKVVISLVTDVTIDEMYRSVYQHIQGQLPADSCCFVRAEPNIGPAAVAAGTLATAFQLPTNPTPSESAKQLVRKFFRALGPMYEVTEEYWTDSRVTIQHNVPLTEVPATNSWIFMRMTGISLRKEFSNGAFAIFSPGEISTMAPHLMEPAWHGQLHFGGEALSSGHAWINGAVNSAWRTVMEVLDTEGLEGKAEELASMWGGPIDDVDMGWYDFDTMGWTEYRVQVEIAKPRAL